VNITLRRLRQIIKEATDRAPDVFVSDLDPSMTVVVVYGEDPRYAQLAPVFDQKGHAFLFSEDTMVVDGNALDEPWFSDDHLMVVQAHELGHKLAGHAGKSDHSNPRLEKEADWLGYNILDYRGFSSAADLHEEEYEARYGTLPGEDDYLMSDIKKYIK
jgi:hypothetical protein